MVRYLRLTTRFNCAPTTVINVYKFFGINKTVKDLGAVGKAIGFRKGSGAYPKDFIGGLNKLFNCENSKSIRQIREHLNQQKPIVIGISAAANRVSFGGHICMLAGISDKYVYVVNRSRKQPTTIRMTIKKLQKFLRRKYSFCILIENIL